MTGRWQLTERDSLSRIVNSVVSYQMSVLVSQSLRLSAAQAQHDGMDLARLDGVLLTNNDAIDGQRTAMLETIDLSKRYDDGTLALDHVGLTVADGEFFCLLGTAGAGKTTLLCLFVDLVRPTTGTAMVDGLVVADAPLEAKARVTYVPANMMLNPHFKTRQNLAFAVQLGTRRRFRRPECHMALRRAGLPEKAFEARYGQLAKGMRQRVGLAMAMLQGRPNLILDEPTAGLDLDSTAAYMDILKQEQQKGATVLMSSCDISLALKYADRIGVLKEGRLIMSRSRNDLEGEDIARFYVDHIDGPAATTS